ncbi:1,4-dihydroxy-2-naphthoate polyprenyltransferase, partial [Enterococcus cecorum]|nr:1,4-dihydroxy-2-naphthoate polyprenyltransferase [Enterococcus cecorum]
YLCFITLTIGLFFGLYHWTILLIWAVFPIIRKNLIQFSKKQIKRETFSISIKNLIVFNGAYALCLLLGLFF